MPNSANTGSMQDDDDDDDRKPPARDWRGNDVQGSSSDLPGQEQTEGEAEKGQASKPGTARKKRRIKKPRDMPRRPLSAYNIFFREQREIILMEKQHEGGDKDAQGDSLFASMAKRVGKRWKELDEASLQRFKRLAEEDLQRYRKEMQEYERKLVRENAKKTRAFQSMSRSLQEGRADSVPDPSQPFATVQTASFATEQTASFATEQTASFAHQFVAQAPEPPSSYHDTGQSWQNTFPADNLQQQPDQSALLADLLRQAIAQQQQQQQTLNPANILSNLGQHESQQGNILNPTNSFHPTQQAQNFNPLFFLEPQQPEMAQDNAVSGIGDAFIENMNNGIFGGAAMPQPEQQPPNQQHAQPSAGSEESALLQWLALALQQGVQPSQGNQSPSDSSNTRPDSSSSRPGGGFGFDPNR